MLSSVSRLLTAECALKLINPWRKMDGPWTMASKPRGDRGQAHGRPRRAGQLHQKLHREGSRPRQGRPFHIPSTANRADRGSLTPRGRVNNAQSVFLAVVEGRGEKQKRPSNQRLLDKPRHTGCIALYSMRPVSRLPPFQCSSAVLSTVYVTDPRYPIKEDTGDRMRAIKMIR
jgi:hypothetical protein